MVNLEPQLESIGVSEGCGHMTELRIMMGTFVHRVARAEYGFQSRREHRLKSRGWQFNSL
jgi:hypothetical protein